MILYRCHAFLQSASTSSSYNYCSTFSVRCDNTIISSSVTDVSEDGDVDDEQQHLHGIGVGIDLGTTNSAVAMMMIDDQNEESPSG